MFDDIFKTNWLEIDDVVIRAFFSLFTLFFVTKMLGKKQVSQLSLFDYVIGISIGNFAAEMTTNVDIQFLNGIVAVILFGVFAYLVSVLTMKSIYLRRFFMGTPTIIIENGKLIEKALKKVKLDMNDLLEECRVAGYFDLSQIESAVMEVNGNLSILPKVDYRPVTVGDMKLKVEPESLCANVIIDGKLMPNNLEAMKKTEPWLQKQLQKQGYYSYEDLLLVTLDKNDQVKVYKKKKKKEIIKILE